MEDKQTRLVRKLYESALGRVLLKLLVRPWVSKLAGAYMDSFLSKSLISSFVESNGIDIRDYEDKRYSSFNDFFTRKIKAENRPISMNPEDLVSPCDGMLSVHRISAESTFDIKGNICTIQELVRDKELADKYDGGLLLKFRLTVSDYHRYHYPDSGVKSDNTRIDGVLHTVHPIAAEHRKIYCENAREYFTLRSDNFGDMLYMQVGALLVGRICNNHEEAVVTRGQEAGCFEYGGSTVIVCLTENQAEIFPEYLDGNADGEVRVKMGETIGRALKRR